MKTDYRYKSHLVRHQQGSVLLWGLVILLTLTVVGVAAARMGITDTRIASNQMFGMMTYQGAESALERVTSLFNIDQTVAAPDNTQSWNFTDPVNNNSGTLNSTGTISMGEPMMCTAQNGYAMTVEMNPDLGGISCRLFRVDSRANLAGTGALSQHAQGIMKYVPADGNAVQ
ncbi:MAG: pilus assembly PilX family protein [Thiolinea sp.]